MNQQEHRDLKRSEQAETEEEREDIMRKAEETLARAGVGPGEDRDRDRDRCRRTEIWEAGPHQVEANLQRRTLRMLFSAGLLA